MPYGPLASPRPLPPLSAEETRRYGRHLVLPEVGIEGQQALKAARVLLVGGGGLGSPLALYLAAAGVGTLGLVEFDTVEETNLQRQILYGQDDLGRPKVDAARQRLSQINPHVRLEAHPRRLERDNALEILGGYDVVADGSDNFPTRYLVNDACVRLGKPNVYGSIFRFEGQVSVFWGDRGPCYRCLFPEPPPAGLVPSCAEGGVLGVLPGVIGCLQAAEVIKLILGRGEPLIGRFLLFDALRLRFRELALPKSPECPVCAGDPRAVVLPDYDAVCEASEGIVDQVFAGREVSVGQVSDWRQEGRELQLVDVREPVEHRIARIEDSRLIPLRELGRRLDEIEPTRPVVLYCHTGVRSLHATDFLRSQGYAQAVSMAGGIEAWSLEIDPRIPRY